MSEKVEVLVRFANESVYYNKIKIDPTKMEDPMVFTDEVFPFLQMRFLKRLMVLELR